MQRIYKNRIVLIIFFRQLLGLGNTKIVVNQLNETTQRCSNVHTSRTERIFQVSADEWCAYNTCSSVSLLGIVNELLCERTHENETRTQSFEILIAKARPEETSLRAVTEATEPETVAATLRRRLFTNIKGNIEGERFFANTARTAFPRKTYAGPTRKNGRLPIRSESFPNVGFRQNSKRPLTPPVIYVLCVCCCFCAVFSYNRVEV